MNPISSAYHQWNANLEADALDYCQDAKGVTAGVLCNEDTVVSDACRTPTNDVDAFVCDDKKMAAVQGTILDGLKEAAKAILSALVGRAK
jgi:hypothetical protein